MRYVSATVTPIGWLSIVLTVSLSSLKVSRDTCSRSTWSMNGNLKCGPGPRGFVVITCPRRRTPAISVGSTTKYESTAKRATRITTTMPTISLNRNDGRMIGGPPRCRINSCDDRSLISDYFGPRSFAKLQVYFRHVNKIVTSQSQNGTAPFRRDQSQEQVDKQWRVQEQS